MAEPTATSTQSRRNGKSAEAFRTISEVAEELDLPQHVLRFWETKFPQVKPLKRGGGRRYYRPDDLILLKRIRSLLYTDGYTIRGVQKLLREKGAKALLEDDSSSSGSNGGVGGDSMANGAAPQAAAPLDVASDSAQRQELIDILAELESIRDGLRKD
jgi:DNA-binding transcriptional MerR regulator